jgi:TRAP-type mannitol/chloroaromatic compound transport system permease large subunit
MQMAFLSPPFGYSLFYLKSVAPSQVTMATIIRGAVPFLVLQGIGVAICILFPATVLWLPRLFYGTS